MRALLLAIAVVSGVLFAAGPVLRATQSLAAGTNPCAGALPVPAELKLPAFVPSGEPVAIEQRMLGYLSTYRYRELGWCVDKGVRDTGPYIDHRMYGTHPSVRIYYSPEVMEWLRNGRRGVPRDGAVIIKEQYGEKPAAYYAGWGNDRLRPTDWTIMIRRKSASADGWYWSEVYTGMFANVTKTSYPNSGFGLYCLRCHASAQTALTFSSLENILGYPGEPIRYRVDNSWRTPAAVVKAVTVASAAPVPSTSPKVLAVQTFPPEPLDTYVSHTHKPPQFVTSDQCMGCHSAANNQAPFGAVMWSKGLNLSEYGEWRWSPMALAGRDPVFYAQLESEIAYAQGMPDPHKRNVLPQQIVDTCMTCHGVMGKRAFAIDHPKAKFKPAMIFDTDPSHPAYHYGGLARDGISCTVCHHVQESAGSLTAFLNKKITGHFDLGDPGKLAGPFADNQIVTHAMNQALAIKPHYDAYVKSARLCASCHTINLPVIDAKTAAASPAPHNVEQATYLEWLNSKYQTEYYPGAGAKSCQDCHMPAGVTDAARGIALSHIVSKIALIQDTGYPRTSHAASYDDRFVRVRKTGFRRHELLGLNAFLLQMFKQYPDVLGVRKADYMSGSATDLDDAIAHVLQQARHATADLHVRTHRTGNALIADVEVVNLTGHRFPSGVGFRRAFLNVEVRDSRAPAGSPPVFVSGRAGADGRILGANGEPLPTESFARDAAGVQQSQPHFDEAHPITRPDQVQIFEELTKDAAGDFTLSFMRRDHEFKDNRLLPAGWKSSGPPVSMPAYFLHATYPAGSAASDPRYRDGRGHAVVRYVIALPPGVDATHLKVHAALYYQSFTPAFRAERAAGKGVAAQRFSAIFGGLDLAGTPLAGWKMLIAQTSSGI